MNLRSSMNLRTGHVANLLESELCKAVAAGKAKRARKVYRALKTVSAAPALKPGDWEHAVDRCKPDEHEKHIRFHEDEYRILRSQLARAKPEERPEIVRKMRLLSKHWQEHRIHKHLTIGPDQAKLAARLAKALEGFLPGPEDPLPYTTATGSQWLLDELNRPELRGTVAYQPEQKWFLDELARQPAAEDPESPGTPARPPVGIVQWHGLRVRVENPQDSLRQWESPEGDTGVVTCRYPYGEIIGTVGEDGDPVDVFVGPNPNADTVYVCHLHNKDVLEWPGGACPRCGSEPQDCFHDLDEHKCLIGMSSDWEARACMEVHYNTDNLIGPITSVPLDRFVVEVMQGLPAIVKAVPGPEPTKSSVHYRPAVSGKQKCGNCEYFHSGECGFLKTKVAADFVCDHWESRGELLRKAISWFRKPAVGPVRVGTPDVVKSAYQSGTTAPAQIHSTAIGGTFHHVVNDSGKTVQARMAQHMAKSGYQIQQHASSFPSGFGRTGGHDLHTSGISGPLTKPTGPLSSPNSRLGDTRRYGVGFTATHPVTGETHHFQFPPAKLSASQFSNIGKPTTEHPSIQKAMEGPAAGIPPFSDRTAWKTSFGGGSGTYEAPHGRYQVFGRGDRTDIHYAPTGGKSKKLRSARNPEHAHQLISEHHSRVVGLEK